MNSHLKKKCEKLCRVREQWWARFQDFYEKAWIWKLKLDISSSHKEYKESRWYDSSRNFKVISQSCRNVFREQS